MVRPSSTMTIPGACPSVASCTTKVFSVPSEPPIPTSRSGNKIDLSSSSVTEDKDRDMSDPDCERDRVERLHLSMHECEWGHEPLQREWEPSICKYNVCDCDQERDSERDRERERDREQREWDREDMDIIHTVASTRSHKPPPTVLQQ